jgi:hypothetical protein
MTNPSPSFQGRRRFLQGNNKKQKKRKAEFRETLKKPSKTNFTVLPCAFSEAMLYTVMCSNETPFLSSALSSDTAFLTTTTKSLLVERQKKKTNKQTNKQTKNPALQQKYNLDTSRQIVQDKSK